MLLLLVCTCTVHWTLKWQLRLNLGKCKSLCISNRRRPLRPTYYVQNSSLEWVDTFKYLGVRLTCKLKWGTHCRDAALKATRVLNLLRRTMSGSSQKAKSMAYTALVRPHLEYCAAVWAPFTQKDCEIIERVQRRAARWITAKWDKTTFLWSKSYEESCHELGWCSLKQRREYLTCCEAYKIVHRLSCTNFDSYLSYSGAIQTRSHHLTLQCLHSRVNAFRYS